MLPEINDENSSQFQCIGTVGLASDIVLPSPESTVDTNDVTATASKLDWALAHAALGYKVFPLIPNGKRPAIKGWQEKATTDRATIIRWWTENPDYNIGIACGPSGIVVLDYDVKKDPEVIKKYAKPIAEAFAASGTPPAEVATPSTGLHQYFRGPTT
jgi:hypothetical protein